MPHLPQLWRGRGGRRAFLRELRDIPRARSPGAEERKLATILFADVMGSTGLGEQLDPERLRASAA